MNRTNKHLVAGLIWSVLFALVYLAIEWQTAPKVSRVTTETEIVVPRSGDGHFYIAGLINGKSIDFLVDTGASTTSISVDSANQLGLSAGKSVTVHTANGMTQGEEHLVQTLALGGITIRRVRILALPNLKGQALLGQNVLRHLEVTQLAREMVLRVPRGAAP